jgi:hypothetical protein
MRQSSVASQVSGNNATDRRLSPRVVVNAPCSVYLIRRQLPGIAQNISRTGMLVHVTNSRGTAVPCVGDIVTIEVQLPESHHFGQKCLRCQGTVTRVCNGLPDPYRRAVGLAISQMGFSDYKKPRKMQRAEGAAVVALSLKGPSL